MITPPADDVEHLTLVALDADDLSVVSAHLQDAVVKVGDIAFLPAESRFALVGKRFDWQSPAGRPRRRLSGLHFERVLRCRTRGIDRSRADDALNLLAVTVESAEAPGAVVRLVFAGGACIQLELECVEAKLKDLGPVWSAESRPEHPLETA